MIWPGLLTGALFGWFLLWMSRKFIARLQGRQGPPFYQPFFDFWKLVVKRPSSPGGESIHFFMPYPVISLLSVVLALALLPVPGGMQFPSMETWFHDILLEMPALIDILAGYVTRSVYAQVGLYEKRS